MNGSHELLQLKMMKWAIYNVAANTIQRAWRHFKLLTAKRILLGTFTKCKSPSESLKLQLSLVNIVMGRASYEEKMQLWRSILEFRRNWSDYSADSCIRALIECKGDLGRAIIVAGNSSFGWRFVKSQKYMYFILIGSNSNFQVASL